MKASQPRLHVGAASGASCRYDGKPSAMTSLATISETRTYRERCAKALRIQTVALTRRHSWGT